MTKKELRKVIRQKRKTLADKTEKDKKIFNNLKAVKAFEAAETVLCYASLDEEIETDSVIRFAFSNGKRVAVPYCIDDEGTMAFYLIHSLSELQPGSFGVREPDINRCSKLCDFKDSVIIVPAMAYDRNGFRLGYGKGYYDRFLENYPFISIGVCYNSFIQNALPIDEHDKPVNIIVTENEIINCNNGGKNG